MLCCNVISSRLCALLFVDHKKSHLCVHLQLEHVDSNLSGRDSDNKLCLTQGSVSVSMSLFQSRLCFVCSHLTSGQKDGAEIRRNSDVHEIIRRTCFSSVFDTDQPQTIPSHE